MVTHPGLLGTLAALAVLLIACGGESEPATAADETAVPEETDPADETDPGDAPVDLAVGATDLGEVLVDGDGMTLYLFTQDPPGESVCEDDCLAAWPPLLVDGEPVAGDGVDRDLVDTIDRDDGTTQLTYDGAPLYRWASDQQPGDVSGQDVQGVWYVVAPDGAAIMEETGTDTTTEPDPAY